MNQRTGMRLIGVLLLALALLAGGALALIGVLRRYAENLPLDPGAEFLTQFESALIVGTVTGFCLVVFSLWLLYREMRHLRQAEEMFRGLLECAPDAVLIANRQGLIVRMNSAAERMFGYSRDELSGLPVQSLTPTGLRERLTRYLGSYLAKPKVRVLGSALKVRALRKDGSEFPVEVSLSPLQSAEGLLVSCAIRDVTRRMRSEKALRESEEMMRFALEADEMGAWEYNLTTNMVSRSPRHDRIYGYDSLQPEWTQEIFLQHVVPEDREQVARSLRHGYETSGSIDFTCRIRRTDGEVRWIRISGRHLGGGASDRIAGVVRDITDEKRSADLLRQNEQFLAGVLDAMPSEIAVIDREGNIISVNGRWKAFSVENGGADEGRTGVGANYLQITSAAACDGDEGAGLAAAGIEAVLAGEQGEFQLEYPCDSETERRWFLMHAVAAPGVVGGAIISHSDISRRKEIEQALRSNEELLRTLILSMPDTVQVKDPQGKWLLANEAAIRHFRLEGIDWKGKTDAEIALIAPPGMVNPITSCIRSDRQAWLDDRPMRDLERVPREDGTVAYFDVIKVPIRDAEGRPKLLVVIGRDITHQQEAEEALRNFNTVLEARVHERTETLEAAMLALREEATERLRLEKEVLRISEREQSRIGQDLHDDLGQQLAGLMMLAHVLATDLKENGHPNSADATRLEHYLHKTIDTTRNLAKSFYPVELERGGLILALQDLAQRTQDLTKVTCTVEADLGFQPEKSSEIHLYRIVQEAINNAIRHGRARHITIRCEVESNRMVLTTANDGVDFTLPASGPWNGMGLHLYRYRARLIGAEIRVARGPHGGCEVVCTLPAQTEPGRVELTGKIA